MEKEVTLRAFEKKDAESIERIIQDTWHYEQFCSTKIAKKMAKLYLATCYANQTFVRVATIENEVVGVIMGKDCKLNAFVFFSHVQVFWSWLNMIFTKEGRKIMKMFEGFAKLDELLLQETQHHYDGELVFFAVDHKKRGKGVGKMLLNAFYDYAKQQRIQHFYLFTDETCNFGFYEYFNLKRKNEKILEIGQGDDAKVMHFFLYDYYFE